MTPPRGYTEDTLVEQPAVWDMFQARLQFVERLSTLPVRPPQCGIIQN